MFRSYCPRSLWCYEIPHVAKIMQTTASFAANLQGRTPLEALTGETPDISQYLEFWLYYRVWFKEDAGLDETKLAILLGVSHQVRSLISYWVLPASGIPMSCTTVQRVTNLESQTEQSTRRSSDLTQVQVDTIPCSDPTVHYIYGAMGSHTSQRSCKSQHHLLKIYKAELHSKP